MTEIITLGPDEKIAAPGFYAIPLSQHHGQPCEGPSVTSSVLRRMELETPADVWAFSPLNPHAWPREETAALRMGVAMAAYVEGGLPRVLEMFRVHEEDKPRRPTAAQLAAYDAGKASEAAKASVEYWRAVEAEPASWLTPAELNEIATMGHVLAHDEAAQRILEGAIPEVTMAWQDEDTGVWVLSRPDTINFDGVVTDYKRIAPAGKPFNGRLVDQRIEAGGYDMQMVLAAEAMERLTGEWPSAIGIIAQSAAVPHHVILRSIDDEEVLRLARWRNRRAIRRWHECFTSGRWPGPGETVGSYWMRDELRERLMQEMNTETAA